MPRSGQPWAILAVLLATIQSGCVPYPPLTQNPMTMREASEQARRNTDRPPASADGMELVIHNPHSGFTRAVALSPDGRYILTGSSDGTAKQWDVASGQMMRTFPRLFGLNGLGPDNVQFSHDGTVATVSSVGGGTHSFDVATGHEHLEFKDKFKLAPGDVSPDGVLRLSEPNDMSKGRLIVEDRATRRTVQTLETGSTARAGVTNTTIFSRDGRHIAWAETDLMGKSMAKVWEVATWRLVATLPASAVNFSRDSRTLVLGRQAGGSPYLRDLRNGEETYLEGGIGPSGITDLAMVKDGRSVVAGMVDGSAVLWDLTTGQLMRTFKCPKDQPVLSVAVSPIDPLVSTGCGDGSVWLWDLQTGKQLRNLAPSLSHSVFTLTTRFSLNGRTLGLGIGEQVILWEMATGKELRRVTMPRGKSSYQIPQYDPSQPTKPKTIDVPYPPQVMEAMSLIRHIAVHPDGQLVAVANGNGVHLWDMRTGLLVRTISDKGAIYLVFSPNGQTLLSEKETWDITTDGKKLTEPMNTESDPMSMIKEMQKNLALVDEIKKIRSGVAVSADSRFVARSEGFAIKVRDLASTKVQELTGYTGSLAALAFTPNGRILVGAGSDGTVRLWDLQSEKEVAALVSLGQREFVTVTPDHYYRASKSPVKGASFAMGDQLLPFEQFEQKLNKPDLVLERLNGVPSGIAEK